MSMLRSCVFENFQENVETIRATCGDQELAFRLGQNELADLTTIEFEVEQRARTTAVLTAAEAVEHETCTPNFEELWN